MDTAQRPLTVVELARRYGVSRQQIYQRLQATDLTPMKRGNRSFFAPEQVGELDRIHELLAQGFSLRDIADDRQLSEDSHLKVEVKATPIRQPDTVAPTQNASHANALEMLADAIASAVKRSESVNSVSPLQVHRDLTEAAERKYVLSTKQLAEILGQSNSSLHGWNIETRRHGFTFVRHGVGKFRVLKSSAFSHINE